MHHLPTMRVRLVNEGVSRGSSTMAALIVEDAFRREFATRWST
jgi:hypothetical protein